MAAIRDESRLTLQAGFASLRGRRPENQDFACFTEPTAPELAYRGFVAALSDGCGGSLGGRTAAELCVRSFLEAYYALPETLGIQQLAARALSSINAWIHAIGRRDPTLANMAATFSALILYGRQAHLVHVGDSRIYRLRGDRLELLTQDHTLKGAGLDHVLYRAIGLEGAVPADYSVHPLEGHDRYLVCSDGLYTALRPSDIQNLLRQRQATARCAESLASAAAARNDSDNITVLVVDVIALPMPGARYLRDALEVLPIAELPRVGDSVDGFLLTERIAGGHYSNLFLASDQRSGAAVVMKFPHPRVAAEADYYRAFTREAWIGLRIKSPWLGEIIEQPPGRQSRLYSVMPHYPGMPLERWITRNHPVRLKQGVGLALKLCKAVHTLHRLGVVHRDIKPENIQILDDGGLRLLDLGIARIPAWDEDADQPVPGTPSYMAPELFHGERGSIASDVFALGVTLFRLFTRGAYPYGEIEPFTKPRFGRPKNLTQLRPDLPAWLDATLQRALAADPRERFGDAMELAFELENGLAKGGQHDPVKPSLYRRNPVLFWQVVALFQLLAFLICLARSHHVPGETAALAGPGKQTSNFH